jgi:hypothetical protein
MNPLRDIEDSLIDGDWGFYCTVQTATNTLDRAGFRDVPRCDGYGEAFELFRTH